MPEDDHHIKPAGFSEARWERIKARVRANCRKAQDPDACTYATMRRIANHIEARGRKSRNLERQEHVKT